MQPAPLSQSVKISLASGAAAAAQTAISGAIQDMQDYDGVLYIAILGDITEDCELSLTAQQNSANATEGMATLEGAAAFVAGASDADSKILLLDVHRPEKRYVRCQLARAKANAVVAAILAVQYRGRQVPTELIGDVIAQHLALTPAEAA